VRVIALLAKPRALLCQLAVCLEQQPVLALQSSGRGFLVLEISHELEVSDLFPEAPILGDQLLVDPH